MGRWGGGTLYVKRESDKKNQKSKPAVVVSGSKYCVCVGGGGAFCRDIPHYWVTLNPLTRDASILPFFFIDYLSYRKSSSDST